MARNRPVRPSPRLPDPPQTTPSPPEEPTGRIRPNVREPEEVDFASPWGRTVPFVYGKGQVNGIPVARWIKASWPSSTLCVLYVVAFGPVSAISNIRFGDLGPTQVGCYYSLTYTGGLSQTLAANILAATGTNYPGFALVYCEFVKDEYAAAVNPARMTCDVTGLSVDPRTDPTLANRYARSNPALAWADYAINPRYGAGIDASRIDWDSVEEVADWCDEQIGSPLRPRFEFGFAFEDQASHEDRFEFIRAHGQFFSVYDGAKYRLVADKPRTASGFDLRDDPSDDANNLLAARVTGLPANQIPNRVVATWADAAYGWRKREIVVSRTGVETGDEQEVTENVSLLGCQSADQARRHATYLLNRGLLDLQFSFRSLRDAMQIDPGSRFTHTGVVTGFTALDLLCTGMVKNADGSWTLGAEVYDAAIYSDTVLDEASPVIPPADPSLPLDDVAFTLATENPPNSPPIVAVDFTPPESAYYGGVEVFYRRSGDTDWIAHGVFFDPVVRFAATEFTTYDVLLRTVNWKSGARSTGVTDSIVVADTTPPVVTGLTATEDFYSDRRVADQGRVILTWTEPSFALLSHYRVTRQVGSGDEVDVGTANSGRAVVPIQEAGDYTFRVYTISRNGSTSAAATVVLSDIPTTPDNLPGVSWSRHGVTSIQFTALEFAQGIFVSLGADYVRHSPDGKIWTQYSTGLSNNWWDLTYGNGLWVATGAGSPSQHIATSADGKTWTLRTSPWATNKTLTSIAYGNGRFVVVTSTGDAAWSLDGHAWTVAASPVAGSWRSLSFGGGVFVAVADDNGTNQIMTSPDGDTWTARTPPTSDYWSAVTYGNGRFVAISYSVKIYSDDGGVTWVVAADGYADQQMMNIAYGGGMFVVVKHCSVTLGLPPPAVVTSYDGDTWRTRESNFYGQWINAAYGNGVFVMQGYNSDTVEFSVLVSGRTDEVIDPPPSVVRLGSSDGSLQESSGDLIFTTNAGTAKTLATTSDLGGYVPTSRQVTAGAGLSGGGNLSADRSLALSISGLTEDSIPAVGDSVATHDLSAGSVKRATLANLFKVINGLTEDTTPDAAADFVVTYDASASGPKKVKLNKVGGGGSFTTGTFSFSITGASGTVYGHYAFLGEVMHISITGTVTVGASPVSYYQFTLPASKTAKYGGYRAPGGYNGPSAYYHCYAQTSTSSGTITVYLEESLAAYQNHTVWLNFWLAIN